MRTTASRRHGCGYCTLSLLVGEIDKRRVSTAQQLLAVISGHGSVHNVVSVSACVSPCAGTAGKHRSRGRPPAMEQQRDGAIVTPTQIGAGAGAGAGPDLLALVPGERMTGMGVHTRTNNTIHPRYDLACVEQSGRE